MSSYALYGQRKESIANKFAMIHTDAVSFSGVTIDPDCQHDWIQGHVGDKKSIPVSVLRRFPEMIRS
jgi:hypothetical protein